MHSSGIADLKRARRLRIYVGNNPNGKKYSFRHRFRQCQISWATEKVEKSRFIQL